MTTTDSEQILPPRALDAVDTILGTKGVNATDDQLANLKRLQNYILAMKRGRRTRGALGRPKTPMRDLIIRHLDRIAPEGKSIKRTALRVSIGSYRPYSEFNEALDKLIVEGEVTQTNDQIVYSGGR